MKDQCGEMGLGTGVVGWSRLFEISDGCKVVVCHGGNPHMVISLHPIPTHMVPKPPHIVDSKKENMSCTVVLWNAVGIRNVDKALF